MPASPITLVLADDHQLLAQGCKALLETEPDMRVVAMAQDGLEALSLTERHRPSILVLDLMIPKLHGTEVARQVASRAPGTKVLILTMHAEATVVRQALRAGAHGFVLKDASVDDLVNGVRHVVAGRRFLSPRLADLAVEVFTNPEDAGRDPYETLTNQERLIFQLTAEGLSAKETGEKLFISARTVEVHRTHILQKLGLKGQNDLVRYAVRRGILQP